MKKLLFLFTFLGITGAIFGQQWKENLDESKAANFYEIQQAFNDYWDPFEVEKGYYLVKGEKQKAGGWKQFKRWEWFWESRVDKQTGAFPEVSNREIYQQELNTNPNRSISGNWTSMGPSTTGGGYAGLGRLNCIGFHPTDNNTYYVGAASGGVWKTSDAGSSWTPISDDIGALGISSIVVEDGGSNDILYIATGDRDASDTYSIGILKSTDGGTTWLSTSLAWTTNQQRLVYKLMQDPSNASVFYASTSLGLYKSTDACDNWTLIYSSNAFIDMEFKPGDSQTLYGSTTNGNIYLSTNGGNNWTNAHIISGGYRTQLAVSANDPNVVYAVAANNSSALKGIYKSTNSGSSYTLAFDGLNLLGWNCNGGGGSGQGWYDLCIIADPNQANTVFVGGVNTWKSVDGGSNWSINNHWSSSCGGNATNVHADKHYLAYQNGSSTLFECNDGGLYSTSDGGSTWNHLGSGLVTSQIYRLGVAQTTDEDVIIGLQDNGTKALLTNTWYDVIGGDGMDCAIDYTDENIQYGSLYYGDIYKTTNHWTSSTNISSGISGSAAWVTPYVIDPNVHTALYVGYQDVWLSTNQGSSWTQLSSWGGSTLRSLAVAPSNSNVIYAATNSIIYKSTNGGGSWTNITNNLPAGSASIKSIAVEEDDPNTLWVSFSGYNSHGVYESTSGGSSWSNISTGLPSIPINSVIQNYQNDNETELYVGTDVGVYVKVGSANWTSFFDGLPNVVVSEVEIYYDDANTANSRIRAATYGRGLWESDLYSISAPPLADFSADNTTPTIVETVNFTDLSTNTPTTWAWTFTPNTITYMEATTASSQHPKVRFDALGYYTVELTASNADGSDTETKTDYIQATNEPPVADFSADNLSPTTIDTVLFTDLSTNTTTAWLWTFTPNSISYLDGTDANSQHPKVRFNDAGLYTVELTATNDGGSDTETKTDYINASIPPPDAEFSSDNNNPTPLETVSFTDLSTGTPDSWDWVFDPTTVTYKEGTNSSSQHPKVTFDVTGSYTVSLTASNAGGSDTETKNDYIIVTDQAPLADFAADNTTPVVGDLVNFTDQSQYTPTNWEWSFDPATITYLDGTSSGSQHPKISFDSPGLYTVSLTATNAGGSSTETKTDYVDAWLQAPEADFKADNVEPVLDETVSFTDQSLHMPDSWAWSFSPSTISYVDGTDENSQHPKVQFNVSGLYSVSLEASNTAGSDMETKTNYIDVLINGLSNSELEQILIWAYDKKIYFKVPEHLQARAEVYNLKGLKLVETNVNNSPIPIHESGFVVVRLLSNTDTRLVKVFIK